MCFMPFALPGRLPLAEKEGFGSWLCHEHSDVCDTVQGSQYLWSLGFPAQSLGIMAYSTLVLGDLNEA